MACIHIHLISSASAVSLVPRPEDWTRLLSSSLRSFSGPAKLSSLSLFCTRMLGRVCERSSRDYLSSCTSTMPCFLFCPYSACVLFALLLQRCGTLSSSILRFSFRLLCCLRGLSRITSRTRLCYIDDPQSFTL